LRHFDVFGVTGKVADAAGSGALAVGGGAMRGSAGSGKS
jgi:hypothetical protein